MVQPLLPQQGRQPHQNHGFFRPAPLPLAGRDRAGPQRVNAPLRRQFPRVPEGTSTAPSLCMRTPASDTSVGFFLHRSTNGGAPLQVILGRGLAEKGGPKAALSHFPAPAGS
jgi:hypothetical protein